MDLEIGDVVMCTVDRVVGTVVFVKIQLGNREVEGGIILSEVAPGRIRNLRDYIVPKKKIVCKVLRISGDRVDMSLRRVTQKEKKEVLAQEKQEKSYASILKSVLKEDVEKIIKEIMKNERIYSFLEESKINPSKLEKLVGKENSKKILDILNAQKPTKAIVKKEISLTTIKPNGLELIKNILGKIKDIKIKYISAGRYVLQAEASDLKTADNKLKEMTNEIEKNANKQELSFSILEK